MERFEALAKLFQIGTGVSARDLGYLFGEIERGVGIILGMNSQLYPQCQGWHIRDFWRESTQYQRLQTSASKAVNLYQQAA